MKRFWPVVVLLGLFRPAQVQAQETPLKALDQTVAPIAWPPPHMQNLPPDYLERLHASLVAGTSRLSRLHYSSSHEHGLHRLGAVRNAFPDPWPARG